jgi:pimeloyl-ACP methyl ester carboxylesterase
VTVPTLVLHSRGDAGIPYSQGLMLARGIPHARFVTLESDNHLILSHEPAWDRYKSEICDFLMEDAMARTRADQGSSPGA